MNGILERPVDVLVGPGGRVYVSESIGHRVRRFTPGGAIETVAGRGTADNYQAGDGLPAAQAQLRFPSGIAFGPDGLLYIADEINRRVRRVGADGIIATVAGTGAIFESPAAPGLRALDVSIWDPSSIAFDAEGRLYVAEKSRHRVWRLGPAGVLELVAGTGEAGYGGDGGPATRAQLRFPFIAIDRDRHTLYVSCAAGCAPTRRVDLRSGLITTLPNVVAWWMRVDLQGKLLYSEGCAVRRLDPVTGATSDVAGGANCGFDGDGGPAVLAALRRVGGAADDGAGNVYIADSHNDRVRRVRPDGTIETVAGGRPAVAAQVPAAQAVVYDTQGLAFDRAGNLFFIDFDHGLIRRLSRGGLVSIVAGTTKSSYFGEGGHPLQAGFDPTGLAFDNRGHLLFIDQSGPAARLISPGSDGLVDGSPDERIVTIAGRLSSDHGQPPDRGSADGGAARNAVLDRPRALALDSRGNLYIADWTDNRVRKVVPGADGVLNGGEDEIITTVAGNGVEATAGDGGFATQASIRRPGGNSIGFDPRDNLYIRGEECCIRRVDARTGIIETFLRFTDITGVREMTFDAVGNLYLSTNTQVYRFDAVTSERALIAGTGAFGFGGDGGDARLATFSGLRDLVVGPDGSLYVGDTGNFRIRKIAFVRR